jgi:hypothetical protein
MKKTILAAIAGFAVAFAAGVISTPPAEAAPSCQTNADCANFSCSSPEQIPVCQRVVTPSGTSGYCRCVY